MPRKISPSVMAAAALEVQRKKHPMYTYKPAGTCARSYKSKARYRLVDGGNGSGKTYGMAQEIVRALTGAHEYRNDGENAKYMLFCLSRNQAHNLWRELLLGEGAAPGVEGKVTHNRGLLPTWQIRRKKGGALDIAWDSAQGRPVPKKITMANGNTLDFYWHGNKHQWEHIQGTAYDGAFIDEAGDDIGRLLYEVMARFRESIAKDIESGGWILWAATDTTASEDFEVWKANGLDPDNPHFEYFHIEAGENPIMTKAVRDAIAAGMPEEEAAIRVHGTRSRGDDLRILQCFDQSIHVLEEPYQPTINDNVYAIYDPGLSDDSAFLIAHTNHKHPSRVVCTKFLTQKNSSVADDARMLLDGLRPFKMRALIYDKCGAGRRDKNSHGKTTIQQLAQVLADKEFLRSCGVKEIWQNGPAYVPPAGQIHDQVQALVGKMTRTLDDDRPEFLIDKPFDANQVSGPGNGLNKFIREVSNWRKKANALGEELRTGNINQKFNEGPDTARYLAIVNPGWVDYGANGDVVVQATEPDNRSEYQRQVDGGAARAEARRNFFSKARRGKARMHDMYKRLNYRG